MTRRNQNAKNKPIANSNSVKTRKWEKLVGWSVEPDYDSCYIDIEAWSKRRYKEGTADSWVEYLCSNDHFCDGISDWNSFIEASLKKDGKCAVSMDFENINEEYGPDTNQVSEKEKIELDKPATGTADLRDIGTGSITLNKGPEVQPDGIKESVGNRSCIGLNNDNSEPRCVRVRPISSNSLPEKKSTCTPPRRHVLSANDYDKYSDDISAPSNAVKFSYTNKDTPKQVDTGFLDHLPPDNVTESSSGQKERITGYDLHHLHLHTGYVLPNSAHVSIGDLLHSHPRIERHFKCARDRDVVFAALANDKDNDLPQGIRHHYFSDHTVVDHSVGLPPVTQNHKNSKDQSTTCTSNKGVHELKTMSSMPRIPLLTYRISKSANEALLQQMDTSGDHLKEITQDGTSPIHSYDTHSRCSDIDVNYTPKSQVMRAKMRPKPRGPPAFRPPTAKTPLHRAMESAHKKMHGPHHHLLSQSSSRLTDKIEASTEKRRWSSSLPSKQHARHTDTVTSDVNNSITWRQELESHIRYQRSTSNSKLSVRVNAPLTNPTITSNNTTITLSKLSRRKKTQLRIGDKLYNVGTLQSAGRSYARINVNR